MKSQFTIGDFPLLRQIKKFPLAAAFAAPVIVSVLSLPLQRRAPSIPDHLRIGAHQYIVPPPLQFLT